MFHTPILDLERVVAEQVRCGFTAGSSVDHFGQDHGNVNNLDLRAVNHFVLLWNCVCDNNKPQMRHYLFWK